MKKTKLFLTALISMFAFTCGVKAEEVSTAEELKNCLAKDGSTCVLAKDIAVEPELIGKTSTGVEVYGKSYSKVSRSFYLGEIDEENIDASFKNGILVVSAPKKKEIETKKTISIKDSK